MQAASFLGDQESLRSLCKLASEYFMIPDSSQPEGTDKSNILGIQVRFYAWNPLESADTRVSLRRFYGSIFCWSRGSKQLCIKAIASPVTFLEIAYEYAWPSPGSVFTYLNYIHVDLGNGVKQLPLSLTFHSFWFHPMRSY